MRIRPAFLAAALAAAPLQAQGGPDLPTADEARAVIAAVLAHQASARGPEGGAQTCVASALAGPPAPPDADFSMAPDHAVRIRFQWHAPEPPARVRPVRAPDTPGAPGRRQRQRQRAAPLELPPPLDPALADRLNALRAEAGRSAAPAALSAIDAALVPAPLRLHETGSDCAPLSLSAPAFAGDAAFVEFAYACGSVCGNGGIYALQRRENRWEVVGVGDTWIN